MRNLTRLAVRIAAAAVATPSLAADPDWSNVGKALGKAGSSQPGGVYRVGLPRTDLKVSLNGVALNPGFALSGWFEPTGKQAMLMGDIVLTQDEVNPVMKKLEDGGIEITAVHNHSLRAEPMTLYMHVFAQGDPVTIATTLHAALALSKAPMESAPSGGGKAAITGDFVLAATEVNPVIKTMQKNGIEVTALHSHMLNEEPRLFFMHF